jgi:riboflavin biosynthesis pyrimidine reductase
MQTVKTMMADSCRLSDASRHRQQTVRAENMKTAMLANAVGFDSDRSPDTANPTRANPIYLYSGTKATAIDTMPLHGPATFLPLKTLLETKLGKVLPLPPNLPRLYGCLRMQLPRSHPHVFSNFVTTLDGVVSLNARGHAGGADISGFSAQDRMVMGLLRAIADVVIVGSGTRNATRRSVWTAEAIFPALADDYRRLCEAMGKHDVPLNVVVSGSGEIDLRLPVFASGEVPALILTTTAGAKRLSKQTAPGSLEIRALRRGAGAIPARAILDEVCRASPGKLILVEGGPRLSGDFYAERLVDEQFLTLAPQTAGRDAGDGRLSLVMGKTFAPQQAALSRRCNA